MSPQPKKALIAVTGFYGPFYPNGDKTGAYYSEVLHPWDVLTKAGYEVVVASENGKVGLDDNSTKSPALNEDEIKIANDAEFPLNKAIKNVQKASGIDPKDFSIFFAAGGHGTCIDFEDAKDLQNIASRIYAQGGAVAAVCHGPVILAGVKDLSTGELLAKGKRVAGFTDEGERIIGIYDFLKEKNYPLVSEVLRKAGGKYEEPAGSWDEFAVADGRLITGTNPASAAITAKKAIASLN